MDWSQCMPLRGLKPPLESGLPEQYYQTPTVDCFFVVAQIFITYTFFFAGIVAVIMLIVGGFRYMFSAGDAKAAGEAQKTITYALIGLVVLLFSFAILSLIGAVTGVTCFQFLGFNNC